MKYFVISDTHSFYTETIKVLKEKGYDQNNEDHTLILCGDAFDRGNESKEMFDWMKSLPKDRFIYIRGNHEDLLEECYEDIVKGKTTGYHHFTNGTIKTICNLCEIHNPYEIGMNEYVDEKIKNNLRGVLDFISDRCVDFFETKHYVFVHGWIPVKSDIFYCLYDKNWRRASKYRKSRSRWLNGMSMRHYNEIKVPNKTVVCGHWHTSWARVNITGELEEEFPANKQDKDMMYETFKPYEEDGIIAIDACTAYSGFVNCIVLED